MLSMISRDSQAETYSQQSDEIGQGHGNKVQYDGDMETGLPNLRKQSSSLYKLGKSESNTSLYGEEEEDSSENSDEFRFEEFLADQSAYIDQSAIDPSQQSNDLVNREEEILGIVQAHKIAKATRYKGQKSFSVKRSMGM